MTNQKQILFGKPVVLLLIWFLGVLAHSAPARESILLPYSAFQNLTQAQQKKYLQEVREAYSQLEISSLRGVPLAEKNSLWQSWLTGPRAWATETAASISDTCMIGGWARPYVDGKCSTKGNGCAGQADGFQCSEIFGNKCVARNGIEELSKRCYTESLSAALPSAEQYAKMASQLEAQYSELCEGGADKKNPDGCKYFRLKLDKLSNGTKPAKADPAPAKTTKVDSPKVPLTCQTKIESLMTDKQSAFAKARIEIQQDWIKFQKLQKICETDFCKALLANSGLQKNRDPKEPTSASAIADETLSRVQLLSAATALIRSKAKLEQRGPADMDSLFKRLHIEPGSDFAKEFVQDYLQSETSDELFELVSRLGRGPHFWNRASHLTQLAEDQAQLETSATQSPSRAPTTKAEMSVVQQLALLTKQAAEHTANLRDSLQSFQSQLKQLQGVLANCPKPTPAPNQQSTSGRSPGPNREQSPAAESVVTPIQPLPATHTHPLLTTPPAPGATAPIKGTDATPLDGLPDRD